MTEKFTNLVPLSLFAPCGIGDATITLQTGQGALLPATGTFRLELDAEIMVGTLTTGDVVSVNRAQEGTAAAAHIVGTTVIPGLTKGAIDQLKADVEASLGTITAAEVTFDDTVDPPTTGATTVQQALDYFKSHPSLPISIAQGGTGLTGAGSVGTVLGVTSPGVLGYIPNAAGGSLANVLFVAKNGNDSTGNGSMGAPFATYAKCVTVIGSAATAINPYSVQFAPGNYTENILLASFITIDGVDISELVYFNGTTELGPSFAGSAFPYSAISNIAFNGPNIPDFNFAALGSTNSVVSLVNCDLGGTGFTIEGTGPTNGGLIWFVGGFSDTITIQDAGLNMWGGANVQNDGAGGNIIVSAVSNPANVTLWGGSVQAGITLNGNAGHACTAVLYGGAGMSGVLTLNGTSASYAATIGGVPGGGVTLTGTASISQYTILGHLPNDNITPAASNGFVLTTTGGHAVWAAPSGGGGSGGLGGITYVGKAGNDSTGTGTFDNPFLTINKANAVVKALGIVAADDSWVIMIGPGVYTENIAFLPNVVYLGFDDAGLTTSVTGAHTLDSTFSGYGDTATTLGAISFASGTVTADFAATGNDALLLIWNCAMGATLTLTGFGSGNPNVWFENCGVSHTVTTNTGGGLFSDETAFVDIVINASSSLSATWFSGGSDAVSGGVTLNGAAHPATAVVQGISYINSLTLNTTTATFVGSIGSIPASLTLTGGALPGQYTIQGKLPPQNVQPSTVSGQVLTTVGTNVVWAAASAGSGGPANIMFVATNGSDTTGTGSFELPFATYGKCVAAIGSSALTASWLVLFAPGSYSENILLANNVSISTFDQDGTATTLTGTIGLGPSFGTVANAFVAASGFLSSGVVTLTFTLASPQFVYFANVDFFSSFTVSGKGDLNSTVFGLSCEWSGPCTATDATLTTSNGFFSSLLTVSAVAAAASAPLVNSSVADNLVVNGNAGHACSVQFQNTSFGIGSGLTLNGTLATFEGGTGSIPNAGVTLTGLAVIGQYVIQGELPPQNVQPSGTNGWVLTTSSGVSVWAAPSGGGGGGIANVLWVAENGDDTTGAGTFSSPFATYGKCVTAIGGAATASNPYTVVFGPGTYAESPISLAPFISLMGFDGTQTFQQPGGQAQTTILNGLVEFSSTFTSVNDVVSLSNVHCAHTGASSVSFNFASGILQSLNLSNVTIDGSFAATGSGTGAHLYMVNVVFNGATNVLQDLTASVSACLFSNDVSVVAVTAGSHLVITGGACLGTMHIIASSGPTQGVQFFDFVTTVEMNGVDGSLAVSIGGIPLAITYIGSATSAQYTVFGHLPPANVDAAGITTGFVLTASGGVAGWAAPTGGGGGGTITALTQDVLASGSGSVAATVVALQAGTITVAASTGVMTWAHGAGPVLQQAALVADVPANGMVIDAQSAFGSATVNVIGGHIFLNPGAGAATSAGSSGSLIVQLSAPTITPGTEATLIVTRGGSLVGAIGGYPANGAAFSAFWLHAPALGNTQYALLGDGANTIVNAPSGFVEIAVGNNNIAMFTTTKFSLPPGLNFQMESGPFGGGIGMIGLGNMSVFPTTAITGGVALGVNTAPGGIQGLHVYGPIPGSTSGLTFADEVVAPIWQVGGGSITTQAYKRAKLYGVCQTTTAGGVTAVFVPCNTNQTVTMLIMFLGGGHGNEQVAIYVQASFTNNGTIPVGATGVTQVQIAKTYDSVPTNLSTATFSLVPVGGGINVQPVGVSSVGIPWEVFVDAFYI